MNKAELEKYYLETTYSVFLNNTQYDCKIGVVLPAAINEILSDALTAAIITAWNPRSQLFDQAENERRNYCFYKELEQAGYSVLRALGKGTDNKWPAEESFFIPGINQATAEKYAEKYEQNAYIWLEYNKPVLLNFSPVWKE